MLDYKIFLLLLSGLIIIATGCKEDDECPDETNVSCPDYDPCWDREPVFADFTMARSARAYIWSNPDIIIYLPFDCKSTFGDVHFFAEDDQATYYYWQVGNNPENDRYTANFTMNFPCATVGEQIPVTLTVSRPGDSACVNWTQVAATVNKTLEIVSIEETIVKGRYRGHLESHPDEEYEIEVEYLPCQEWFTNTSIDCVCEEPVIIYHNLLNHGCANTATRSPGYNSITSHTFYFVDATNGCNLPEDYARLQIDEALLRLGENDSIRIDMDVIYAGSPTLPMARGLESFTGVRVE